MTQSFVPKLLVTAGESKLQFILGENPTRIRTMDAVSTVSTVEKGLPALKNVITEYIAVEILNLMERAGENRRG
jgi:hypothetical protein